MEEQRHEATRPGHGGTREEVVAEAERGQQAVRARQGSSRAADPSVRRGLPRRVALFGLIGAAVGVVIALALIPVLWNVALLVSLAAVGAVIGAVLGLLAAGEREDGLVDERVRR
jgi:hypothetical protein